MASEPRLVILPPQSEHRIMRIRARQAGLREGLFWTGVGCVAFEIATFIAWLVGTVNSDPIVNPAPGWVHSCKWIELTVAVLTAIVIVGNELYYRRLKKEKHRLSQQRKPCVITNPEFQRLADKLEATCDTALAESSGYWDDILLILQLRYHGYTQLLEAQSEVPVEDSFTKTLEEVEAVRVRHVQRRQTTALAN